MVDAITLLCQCVNKNITLLIIWLIKFIFLKSIKVLFLISCEICNEYREYRIFYQIKLHFMSLKKYFSYKLLQEPVTNNKIFSFFSFEYFLLHTFRPLFVGISIWFYFHSCRQDQFLNSLLGNTLSHRLAVRYTKFYLKVITAV